MRTASALAARFDRMERLARTANGLPKNSSPYAGALDAATITEPIVPLVQAEVVTDESGHRYVLHPEPYRSGELTKRAGSTVALGAH